MVLKGGAKWNLLTRSGLMEAGLSGIMRPPLQVEDAVVQKDCELTFDPIRVPGAWSVQGWDKPHYTNVIMPFKNTRPFPPEENPTGVYKKTVYCRRRVDEQENNSQGW